MKEIVLNGALWQNEKDMHADLAQALSFPSYYGANFDALHDCLTELDEVSLVIEGCTKAQETLGRRWQIAMRVFWDSVNENDRLQVTLRE